MMEFTSHYLFGAAGNIVPLNAWVPEHVIDQIEDLNADPKNVEIYRNGDEYAYEGNKRGAQYNFVPEDWQIPDHVGTLSSLIYDRGDYLYPHRDKWRGVKPDGRVNYDGFRMICHVNNTDPTEFCFVVNGEIFKPEPRRWYAINTQLVHHGFCYKDNTYHLTCDLSLQPEDKEKTVSWLLNVLPWAQDPNDNKGVHCTRN